MEIPAEALQQLKLFVSIVKGNPQVLNMPQLDFFKSFIESFGGKVPSPTAGPRPTPQSSSSTGAESSSQQESKVEEESEESDIELDKTGVIEADTPEPLKDFTPGVEVSEEDLGKSNELKIAAIGALQEGNLDEAYRLFSEAIDANPNSALLYAKRGQCSLRREKPNACIQDCTRAIEINPDCAVAYKFRGRAQRLLGKWEEAAKDLRDACKIDFDEEADDWLREVTPNARKLEEHRRKYERKRAEKESRERAERIKRAKEEHAKAAAREKQREKDEEDDDPLSGAGMDFASFLYDPELKSAFKDPEVAAAFQDISTNPANIIKYQDNPRVLAVIEKLKSKFTEMSGGGGGFSPFSAFGAPPQPPSAPGHDDVGLD